MRFLAADRGGIEWGGGGPPLSGDSLLSALNFRERANHLLNSEGKKGINAATCLRKKLTMMMLLLKMMRLVLDVRCTKYDDKMTTTMRRRRRTR